MTFLTGRAASSGTPKPFSRLTRRYDTEPKLSMFSNRFRFTSGLLALALCVSLAGVFSAFAQTDTEEPAERAMPELQVDHTPITDVPSPAIVSYADVLEDVTPAIVGVYPSRVVTVNRGGAQNPLQELFRRYYGLPGPSDSDEPTREQRMQLGLGSGVLVSEEGYILTNYHVVTDERGNPADEIRVRLSDDREFEAELVGSDAKTDVAVLKIEGEDEDTVFPSLMLADSNRLRVGDVVFAVGNPLGVGLTVTQGIVSAKNRTNLGILGRQADFQGYEDFIQTDASINPGNSGGALVDAVGRVVGINTAIISRTGGNIGIGFAIPINLARDVMESLIESGSVRRGFLGVRISDLESDLAEAFQLPSASGALIEEIQDGMPADQAGLERGDVIVSVDGDAVGDANELRFAIAQRSPGEEVEIAYYRDGERQSRIVVLGDLDDPFAAAVGEAADILEGVMMGALDEEAREQFSVPETVEGLVVKEVTIDSPFSRTLRPGMVVVEVNDQAIGSVSDLRGALREGVNKFWIYFRGSFGYLAVRNR